MNIGNTIILIIGAIIILFGIGAFLYPNLSRWINAPGGPKLKAIISIIVGIILILISFIVEI